MCRTRCRAEAPGTDRRRHSSRDDDQETEDHTCAVTRIVLRPHDPSTGEEVEKEEVVKGHEYQRGQFVTFTPSELKALDLESSKVIDLETFVPRGEFDPVYFNTPYYLYPDGQMALEAIRGRCQVCIFSTSDGCIISRHYLGFG